MMLQGSARPYVCLRCLHASRHASLPRQPSFRAQYQALTATVNAHRAYKTERKPFRYNSGKNGSRYESKKSQAWREASDIRERLRDWEAKNHDTARTLLEDQPFSEKLGNFLTRSQTARTYAEDTSLKTPTADLFDGDILTDLRAQTSALQPGDLVETRFGGNSIPILGVCLGRHRGNQWFFMNTGEVLAYNSLPTLFTVINYVDPAEFQDIVRILPEQPPTRPRNVLAHTHTPEALEESALLQEKLVKFYADAVSIGQNALFYLDRASVVVAHDTEPSYLSLEELADRVLPDFMKRGGKLPPHTLYALHLALQRDGWGARPVNLRWHRRNYIYEIQPKSDIELFSSVLGKVRKLVDGAAMRDDPGKSTSLLRQNDLGRFIVKARAAIQASRTRRAYTTHGMIGPATEPVAKFPDWNGDDLKFIRFIELWACRRVSPEASRVDSLASTILRLTKMYEGSSWVAHWTGFTFLQEIGWIPPWDVAARYDYRFPGATVGRGQPIVRQKVDIEASMRDDIAAGARMDWGDVKVFCVDSAQTADVDDGFSIERTDKEGEYWLHIHIADPASRIKPNSPFAEYMEAVPASLYLAGFPEKMMPEKVEKQFSLNPGFPTLTFSARINERGEVLDHSIKPGTIHNVVHMTQEEVSSVLPGASPSESNPLFAVGTEPPSPGPVKVITTADQLTAQDKDDLVLMHRLSKALRDRRVEKGQVSVAQDRKPALTVSMDSVKSHKDVSDASASISWSGDPYIKLSQKTMTEADRLVETMMHTAGEVAATWCQARDIAVPYSTQPDASHNADALQALRQEALEPLAADGKPIPAVIIEQLYTLIGTSELSSRAAPFYSVGLDAYAKASSPLRRYTDLIVHWQIHAALARERETGTSLVGTDCSEADFLPWTRSVLDPKLPVLQARQRQIREVDNRDGASQWLFQALLRAWKFGEAPLPKTFDFEVLSVPHYGVRGKLLNFFGITAIIPLSQLSERTKLSGREPGEVLQVRISDVNVVTMVVEVTPLLEEKVVEAEGETVEDVVVA
ncbi:mitochondrial protein cyt-4 [Plectosphaerella plurivora]|uniref:Mitochondrial protein cyt-4 n=1 Tax=Plectosphaerella plurivora TaxID=936078 RepID=A0A9P8VD69_9PEZI|nr:mitochondrial protein cyt-4 [Plectosphaerella plurivora]